MKRRLVVRLAFDLEAPGHDCPARQLLLGPADGAARELVDDIVYGADMAFWESIRVVNARWADEPD